MAQSYVDTPAGEGKACGGMGSSKSSAGYKKLMAAANKGGKSFKVESAGKMSEKTKE